MGLENQDFTRYQSDTTILLFEIVDEEGTQLDIIGSTVVWKLYKGNIVVITKTLADGVTVLDAENGVVEVYLSSEDTASLLGNYTHALTLEDVHGNVTTVATGEATFKQNYSN